MSFIKLSRALFFYAWILLLLKSSRLHLESSSTGVVVYGFVGQPCNFRRLRHKGFGLVHAKRPKETTADNNVEKSVRPRSGRKKTVNDLVAKIGLKPVADADAPGEQLESGIVKPASDISLATQLDYARNGHAVLRNFVDPSTLTVIREELQSLMKDEELLAWRQKVQVASNSPELAASCHSISQCQKELEKMGVTASLPFLQYFNTWRKVDSVKRLAFSLGEAASVLLDVPSVRLYQDSVFWKRVGDGPTPWHADARMAPFDTSHFVTFWIPLQRVPPGGTGLLFCSKSHSDFALPYWNPIESEGEADSEWNHLEQRYPKEAVQYMPLELSDVTVHSGWTLHCADGTTRDSVDRMAVAISFLDARAGLRADAMDDAGLGDNEDRWSYQDWAHSIPPRRQFTHPLVPIVWPPKRRHEP